MTHESNAAELTPSRRAGSYGTRLGRPAALRANFEPHIDELDKALVATSFGPGQVAQFECWLRKRISAGGSEGVVESQAISVKRGVWPTPVDHFLAPGDFGKITRKMVVEQAIQSRESKDWRPLLVLSFAWGHGTIGYGPDRLRRILESKSSSDLNSILGQAILGLDAGKPVDAYGSLRGAIKGLGPAFFTKFLYFAACAGDPEPSADSSHSEKGESIAKPPALILDRVVARAIRKHAAAVAITQGISDAPEGFAKWLWHDGNWSHHRYETYLQWMAVRTSELSKKVDDWGTRTDLLELALFTPTHPFDQLGCECPPD